MGPESMIGPSTGMTPIFSPNDKREDDPEKFRMIAMIPPKKRTVIPRMITTINMGRFLPGMVFGFIGPKETGPGRGCFGFSVPASLNGLYLFGLNFDSGLVGCVTLMALDLTRFLFFHLCFLGFIL